MGTKSETIREARRILKQEKALPSSLYDILLTDHDRLAVIQGASPKGTDFVSEISRRMGHLRGLVLYLTEPEAEVAFYEMDELGLICEVHIGRKTSYSLLN